MENLFDEFKPVTKEEWRKKIEKDLKGKEYDSLKTELERGIPIAPVYDRSDAEPVNQPFRTEANWHIVQEILAMDAEQANKQALDHLNRGAGSLLFYLVPNIDLNVLLKDILIEHIHIHFITEGNGVEIRDHLKAIISERGLEPSAVSGSINIDCLENLARTGNWFKSEKEDFAELQALLNDTPENLRTLCINANLFANAGASLSQQNGIALAMAYEYIHQLKLKDTNRFWFNFAIGSDYFGEIARLRAFRRVWQQLQTELGLKNYPAHIYGETSLRNKTISDAYNNMIRSTSECMAGAIGGCDEFSVKGFDVTFREPSSFGERVAKNQQSILQYESHLNAVNDMAEGAYFIEEITEELAATSWKFFKQIEAQGGYLSALNSGWLQEQVEEAAAGAQEAFDAQEKILIGSNKHQKKDEDLAALIEHGLFYKENKKETAVKPLAVKRLAEKLEKTA